MKITEYGTVAARDRSELHQYVAQDIADGWQPIGGVCVTNLEAGGSSFADIRYYQAMVKYEIEKPRTDGGSL